MKRFVTSKVVSKINDNAFCLSCFKQNDEIFLVYCIIYRLKFHTDFADSYKTFYYRGDDIARQKQLIGSISDFKNREMRNLYNF